MVKQMTKIKQQKIKAIENNDKAKILLVDDRPDNIVVLQKLLKSVPVEIHSAISGNDALSLMLRNEYAVVLVDVQMPEMDGFELVGLMRENPSTTSIPVIFVTAINIEKQYIYQGYDVGATDYLLKPVDKKILLAKIQVLLDMQKKIKYLQAKLSYYDQIDDVGLIGDLEKNAESYLASRQDNVLPKVLIVDDKEENLFSMEMVLKKLPVEIIKASSGKTALSLIEKTNFSLVLLDVQMPIMDGFSAAEIIRSSKRNDTLPIIFVTAIDKEDKYVSRGYQSGAVDYLFKPLDSNILLSKVTIFVNLYNQRVLLQRMVFEKEGMLTKIQKQNNELSYLAYHDPLTGATNRTGFEQVLANALENANRYKRKFAVLLIDLDHFKAVNDSYGHDYGDIVLKETAKRLKSTLRKTDHVARLGGDEFAVILEEINSFHDAGYVAKNIVESVSKTFSVFNKELRVSISVGIACYPCEDTAAEITDPGIMVRNADIAMFRAKSQRNNVYEFYTNEFSLKHQKILIIESGLKFAIERNELFLVFQPKIDIVNAKVIGAEVLLRWQHPEHGLIAPSQFIPIAENTQMIIPIGEWVIRKSFEQFNLWKQLTGQSIKIAINLSAYQLLNQNFLERIDAVTKELHIDPTMIEFELTESAFMGDLTEVSKLLTHLNSVGYIFSIDDFGTGYSMLSYLKNLPFRSLKIDIEFIRDLLQNESSQAIVKAIIDLCKNFNLSVIAEGVETEEQVNFLRMHGCQYAQGYYFSEPLLPDIMLEFIKQFNDKESVPVNEG